MFCSRDLKFQHLLPPGIIKTTAKRNGQPDISAEVKYIYNAKGQISKKAEYPGFINRRYYRIGCGT